MNAEFPMLNTTLCYLEQGGKWLMLHLSLIHISEPTRH